MTSLLSANVCVCSWESLSAFLCCFLPAAYSFSLSHLQFFLILFPFFLHVLVSSASKPSPPVCDQAVKARCIHSRSVTATPNHFLFITRNFLLSWNSPQGQRERCEDVGGQRQRMGSNRNKRHVCVFRLSSIGCVIFENKIQQLENVYKHSQIETQMHSGIPSWACCCVTGQVSHLLQHDHWRWTWIKCYLMQCPHTPSLLVTTTNFVLFE